MAGQVATHHWSITVAPVETIAPHSGCGGCAPNPRKPRIEKLKIALGFPHVILAMAVAAALGASLMRRPQKNDQDAHRHFGIRHAPVGHARTAVSEARTRGSSSA
jgi:hypothetical protein